MWQSVHLQNCSPSQTMTFTQFNKIEDREAAAIAIRKLERISISNLENCLRLLKHNVAHFHPDHFVVLNTSNIKTLKVAIKTLAMHEALLRGMKIKSEHRCVLHVGGVYEDKEKALVQFIENWVDLPHSLQRLVILKNDDISFNVDDTLYLCEKLDIPLVFDLHYHLANNGEHSWQENWQRVIQTWKNSSLPVKMHISSPRSEKDHMLIILTPICFLNFYRKLIV